MRAESIKIECEDDGFHIVIDGDSIDPEYQAGCYSWLITDPEALYDHVKAAIGPWLYERDQAKAEYEQAVSRGTGPAAAFLCSVEDIDESGGYDVSDPKHPRFHSTHADIHDMRERNPDEYEYLMLERKREKEGE